MASNYIESTTGKRDNNEVSLHPELQINVQSTRSKNEQRSSIESNHTWIGRRDRTDLCFSNEREAHINNDVSLNLN